MPLIFFNQEKVLDTRNEMNATYLIKNVGRGRERRRQGRSGEELEEGRERRGGEKERERKKTRREMSR